MNSFELDIIDEKSRIGAEFLADVISEIQRAVATEKETRKITQQAIAEKIGTSRSVINRQILGYENITIRRAAELLWAVGWEPYFEAKKPSAGNCDFLTPRIQPSAPVPPPVDRPSSEMLGGKNILEILEQNKAASMSLG